MDLVSAELPAKTLVVAIDPGIPRRGATGRGTRRQVERIQRQLDRAIERTLDRGLA